jgi:molecular chaperone DnaJ
MARDYYAVLGIAATAGTREIKQAYRRLARQYSPDVNFWEHEARTIFDEILEAYRVLSDPTARAMYDRFGPTGALEAGRRGEDVHVAVEVTFAQAARGVKIDLDVSRFSSCGACGATGVLDAHPCATCRGRGVRRSMEAVAVVVPAGVDSGTEIRVRDEGSAAPYGGPRGDLVVSTRVRDHPFFKRQGDSIHCDVSISVWEALRGGRIRVPTPTGTAWLVIPPGTAAGQVFRLRGQGIPKLMDGTMGDLFVTIGITVPTGLDARTDELVRELERLLPTNARSEFERYAGGGE